MTPNEITQHALSDGLKGLQNQADCFAMATIVRTAGMTSAKPGAKALLRADGTVIEGWLGGACVRGAVKTATLRAYATGQPQFISVAPEESLSDIGVKAGDDVDGVHFAKNGCPSKGTVDVFIEPFFPQPELVIFGVSPVAQLLAELAPQFGWDVSTLDLDAGQELMVMPGKSRFVIIATQGQGDLAALKAALNVSADHVAFVGSRRKYAALSEKLTASGFGQEAIASVHAPAGLDIGAVTPAEIALSILAELTHAKRRSFPKALAETET